MKRKIKWGILATGKIAQKFASDIKLVADADLIAVASRDLNRGKAFAKEFNISKCYGSYSELANSSEVEVVYIATPHVFHYENTMMCLEAGKHVLCEKPIGMNSKQLVQMIKKAKEKDLFLMEALWTRFIPSYIKFRDLVHNGSVGEVKLIQSDFGFIANKEPGNRLINKDLGGGSLLDIGIYPVFLSLDIAGEPDKVHSSAIFSQSGVDDSCNILFTYNDKKILASLCSTIVTNTPVESVIYGTEGKIKLNRLWHTPSSIDLSRGDHFEHFKFDEKGYGYLYEVMEVNRCLKEGKTESDIFPLTKSLQLHRILDTIRLQIGLKYDVDNL